MTGKCPHCKNPLSTIRLEKTEIVVSPLEGDGGPYHGVKYVCPQCGSILGVSIDPVALKNETASEVVKRLRKG